MKIGLITEVVGWNSMRYMYGGLTQALARHHEVIYRPFEYFYASRQRQEELLQDFLLSCDLLIGRADSKVLETRGHIGKDLPLICFLVGTMSRGAMDIAPVTRYLKSTDILVGNCTGDIEILRKFFTGAQIRNLPFAFDESAFYPADEDERQAIKAKMGFKKADKILLYSGRVTIEKNLHTVLKLFSALKNLIPDLHLVVAGQFRDNPFHEFGVYSVNIAGTFAQLVHELRLKPNCVHFVGSKSAAQLRDIYVVADVLVNMTLHHDENFGFAQVEATACGTPVVGTSWGGLKDSIKDGETGYQVSAVVTGSGIKVNWWEAINRIVYLLTDEAARRQFSERCRTFAIEKFSMARYSEILESIIADCAKARKNKNEPLPVSDFANRFWSQCQPRSMAPPPFQRGPQALKLYKELITPFTDMSGNNIPPEEELKPQQLLILASPVRTENGTIRIDDPIYPFELVIPEAHRKTCDAVLNAMRKEPAIEVGRLEGLVCPRTKNSLQNALRWMFEAGILLRTNPINALVDPRAIGEEMSKPLFSIQNVNYMTDVIVVR